MRTSGAVLGDTTHPDKRVPRSLSRAAGWKRRAVEGREANPAGESRRSDFGNEAGWDEMRYVRRVEGTM